MKFILAIISSVLFVGTSLADDEPAGVWFAKYGQSRQTNESKFVAKSSSIADLVTASAQRHNVPARIAHAVVKVESGYNCRARSHAGAVGIMQTLPATARSVGITGSLTNCAIGLEAGMRYLAQIVRSHGTSCAAVSLYERGAYARPVCTNYGRKIILLASR